MGRTVWSQGDHQGSPYFNTLDFYHLESSDTLTILSHFKNAAADQRVELRRVQRPYGTQLVW